MQCVTSDNVHLKEGTLEMRKKSSKQLKHLILPYVSVQIVHS